MNALRDSRSRNILTRTYWILPLFALAATDSLGAQAAPQRPAGAPSQPIPSYRARLLGVYDQNSGAPLQGVEIADWLAGTSAVTSATGTVSLGFIPDGGGMVRIRKVGYAAQVIPVAISPSDTVPITVLLVPVTELPAVVVQDSSAQRSPALRGFSDRRRTQVGGRFIDEAALRKEDGRPLGEVLRAHVPGINLVNARGSAEFLMSSHRCTNGGQPDVYLDGVPLVHEPDARWTQSLPSRLALGIHEPPNAGQADPRIPIDIAQFHVSDLAAVEVYLDSEVLPIQFSHGQGCGAILLWTRER